MKEIKSSGAAVGATTPPIGRTGRGESAALRASGHGGKVVSSLHLENHHGRRRAELTSARSLKMVGVSLAARAREAVARERALSVGRHRDCRATMTLEIPRSRTEVSFDGDIKLACHASVSISP